MATTSYALEVRDVDVTYPDGTVAVRGVSVGVEPGSVLSLLGASGSGKSTLLRGIAGLEDVTAGQILLDGEDIAEVPVHRRNIGMVFQDGQLFPHRNVGRNISYGLEMAGVPKEQRKEQIDKMLSLIDLDGYAERPIRSLSGGQAQRVALARTLAPEPKVVLLDEPFSALDRGLRATLAPQVRDILASTNTTAVHVTHDHTEARAIATHVAILDHGKLIAHGTWDEIDSAAATDPRIERLLG